MKKILFILAIIGIADVCISCKNENNISKEESIEVMHVEENEPQLLTENNEIEIQTITDSENMEKESKMAENYNWEEKFYITKIDDELFDRIKGRSYKDNCTLPLGDLRYLHILHKDLKGETLEGELICNTYIAEDVLDIFKELYKANYPIEKVRLIDEYDADDESSMEDNNSSGFNYRFISYTNIVSKHGLGLAIDINPLYNPYTKIVNGKRSVEPANAVEYLDREKEFAYKINHEDLCYKLFIEHGFEWGGDWSDSKDYQHFELPDEVVGKLYPENN